ncbi:hypothetical protein CI109_102062 [Kwoniella shandongensis]|uniref:Transcription factor TFIIIC triple barrel domain-containing protein n=1 Tax=Kwoniella shandongensis TaxID=1734106 RepID=A0AAJ8MWG0_9TREE
MLEYIYICRHGFRSNWVDPSIKSSPTGMNRDPPLAAYGTEQSQILASFLSSSEKTAPYPTPQKVFSSPFYRCIETAIPTAQALGEVGEGKGVLLEHGVMEWYSPVRPNSGLHPRPSSPSKLIPFFPSQHISPEYQSTLFPSRKGESLAEIHDRAELFVEAWVGRVESEWPEVKCVVIFAHAASLIALGRALTGDRTLDVIAGCASTSLYQRKPPSSFSLGSSSNRSLTDLTKSRSTSSLNAADSLLALSTTSPSNTATGTGSSETASSSTSSTLPCGVGQWSIVYNGRADYLPNGLERNWSFADVVLKEDGEVVFDNGDGEGHQVEDEWPEGLRDGADRWLRRGRPPFGAGAGAGGQGSKM